MPLDPSGRRARVRFKTQSVLIADDRERPRWPRLQDHEPVPVVQGAALLRRRIVAARARLRGAAIPVALARGELETACGQIHAALSYRLEDVAAHGVDFLGVLIDVRDHFAVR